MPGRGWESFGRWALIVGGEWSLGVVVAHGRLCAKSDFRRVVVVAFSG